MRRNVPSRARCSGPRCPGLGFLGPGFLGLLILSVLAACAPRVVPPGEVGKPGDVPRIESTSIAVMGDGAGLPLQMWSPKDYGGGAIMAGVVALHGFGDYSNAFRELGEKLAAAGVAVYAIDQRGFGAAPDRGFWHGAERMATDAETMVRLVKRALPGKPVYLLGESMGGAVAMLALSAPDTVADGAVLSAPAVWGRDWMPAPQVWGLELLAHTMPWLPLEPRGLKIKPSDNIAMLRRLARDPLFIRAPRADAVHGLVSLMDAAQMAAPALTKPVLVLYGGRDELVPRLPTCAMLRSLPGTPRRWRVAVYSEGYHMLFRDLDGARVIADIAAWSRDPAAVLPSGNERGPGAAGLDAFCAEDR